MVEVPLTEARYRNHYRYLRWAPATCPKCGLVSPTQVLTMYDEDSSVVASVRCPSCETIILYPGCVASYEVREQASWVQRLVCVVPPGLRLETELNPATKDDHVSSALAGMILAYEQKEASIWPELHFAGELTRRYPIPYRPILPETSVYFLERCRLMGPPPGSQISSDPEWLDYLVEVFMEARASGSRPYVPECITSADQLKTVWFETLGSDAWTPFGSGKIPVGVRGDTYSPASYRNYLA